MDSVLAALEEALALGDTIVIVRAAAATAEVAGGRLRRGQEWLTVGDEGAGASHVHIKLSEIDALRFRHADGHNAALDVLNANGEGIVSLSFRKTGRRSPPRSHSERRERRCGRRRGESGARRFRTA